MIVSIRSMLVAALAAFAIHCSAPLALALPTPTDVINEVTAGARDAGLDLQGRSFARPGPVIPGLGATGTIVVPLDESGRPSGLKASQGVFAVTIRVGFVSGVGEVFANVTVIDMRTGEVVAGGGDGLSNDQFRALLEKHGLGAGKTQDEVMNSPAFRQEFAAAHVNTFREAVTQALRAVGVAGGRFDTSRFVNSSEVQSGGSRSASAPPVRPAPRVSDLPPEADDASPPPPVRVRGGLDNLGVTMERLTDAEVFAIAREFGALSARAVVPPPPSDAKAPPVPEATAPEPRRQKQPTDEDKDLFAEVFFGAALTFGASGIADRNERERPGGLTHELLDDSESGFAKSSVDGSLAANMSDSEATGLFAGDFSSGGPDTRGRQAFDELPAPAPTLVVGAFSPDTSALLLPVVLAPGAGNLIAPIVLAPVVPPPVVVDVPAPVPTGVSFTATLPFLTSSVAQGGGVTVTDISLATATTVNLTVNGTTAPAVLDSLFAFNNFDTNRYIVNTSGQNSLTPFNLGVTVTGTSLQNIDFFGTPLRELVDPRVTGLTQNAGIILAPPETRVLFRP